MSAAPPAAPAARTLLDVESEAFAVAIAVALAVAIGSLFAAARADSPAPSAALTARVLADADAAMARTPAAKIAPTSASGAGASLWTRLAALFGGAGALADRCGVCA